MGLFQPLFFWFFAILGIAGGVGLITQRNPILAALSLILNFFSIAGLYLSLQAEFIAIIQILVYAGAIMVLFLFVIMLLNMQDEAKKPFDISRGIAFILGAAFLGEMFYVFNHFMGKSVSGAFVIGDKAMGNVEQIGRAMMTQYLFPFEMISVVLLAALIGAIVVAKKHSYN